MDCLHSNISQCNNMFYSICPQTFWGLGLRCRRVVSELQQTMWDLKDLKHLCELASNKAAGLKLKSYQKWRTQCMFIAPSTICCAVSVCFCKCLYLFLLVSHFASDQCAASHVGSHLQTCYLQLFRLFSLNPKPYLQPKVQHL